MLNLKEQILETSRQNTFGNLSPWFDARLDEMISNKTDLYDIVFPEIIDLYDITNNIIVQLSKYRQQSNINKVVIGMSGGVDSALTAVLFRDAGWKVYGITMPIHQNEDETKRGIKLCKLLNIEHLHIDLSYNFDNMVQTMELIDFDLGHDNKATKIRKGNIRARLRMITLYNYASAIGGLVASTDNFSELAMGFWTLHGDVGDLSPIQSLNKSWEVPMAARILDVPNEIWQATPTDGLGVDKGDEAQFGFTYLELDIMLFTIGAIINNGFKYDQLINMGGVNRKNLSILLDNFNDDVRAQNVFNNLLDRMNNTWFKRCNPINLYHPSSNNLRYRYLNDIDGEFSLPNILK